MLLNIWSVFRSIPKGEWCGASMNSALLASTRFLTNMFHKHSFRWSETIWCACNATVTSTTDNLWKYSHNYWRRLFSHGLLLFTRVWHNCFIPPQFVLSTWRPVIELSFIYLYVTYRIDLKCICFIISPAAVFTNHPIISLYMLLGAFIRMVPTEYTSNFICEWQIVAVCYGVNSYAVHVDRMCKACDSRAFTSTEQDAITMGCHNIRISPRGDLALAILWLCITFR